jgi:hypothetical protein
MNGLAVMAWLQKIRLMVASTVHRQGRFLRGQVYELAVTLMIIGVAMLLFLLGLVAGGVAGYMALRNLVGQAGAMGIITALFLAGAVVLAFVGHKMQQVGMSRSASDYDDTDRRSRRDRQGEAGYSDEFHSRGSATYPPGLASPSRGISDMKQQLDKPLDMVKQYPVTSMGVALGLGMLLGRSKAARKAMKTAMKVGGKMLLDHYLHSRS